MNSVETDRMAITAPSPGAMNLLRDCVNARPGERVLIVKEPHDTGYYDHEAQRLAAAAGRAMGVHVYETEAPTEVKGSPALTAFINSLRGFDHVVFFARIGDQLRFSEVPGMPPATMCYTLDHAMLESDFGAACHQGMCEMKAAIDSVFDSAKEVRVRCPSGTDLVGNSAAFAKTAAAPIEVTLKRFPMLVPRPVSTVGFSGRVALTRFLVGTGNRFYEPYSLPLDSTVFATFSGNRITGFEGPEAARVIAHYEDIAGRFDLEPWFVHSWHAGIHPGCRFDADATHQIIRWSGSAFGNPRVLHFHTCGDFAPGEISWNVFDPTITVDGVALWQDGRLMPEAVPTCAQVLDRHPHLLALFSNPCRDIGIFEG